MREEEGSGQVQQEESEKDVPKDLRKLLELKRFSTIPADEMRMPSKNLHFNYFYTRILIRS